MSNKTTLQSHNTQLQGLIDKANALPDSSGSGNVETCTVVVNFPADAQWDIEYTKLSAGILMLDNVSTLGPSGEVTFEVVKNTMMSVAHSIGGGTGFTFVASGEVYDFVVGNSAVVFEVCGDGAIELTGNGTTD